MAKKKVIHQEKPPQETQKHSHQAPAMVDITEKLETLKSLNSMLLKETVERRQQVDSLLHSKGSLELDLTRSQVEKQVLHTELGRLSEGTVLLELERSVVFVFVAVQLNQQAEVIYKERDGLRREKIELEKRLEILERNMREIVSEKGEVEKVKSEKEFEVGLLKEELSKLACEIDIERDGSNQASRERDAMRAELDTQIGEANALKLKLIKTEKREKEIREEIRKLKLEYDNVVEERREREGRIELLMRDKDSIKSSLEESNRVTKELQREIEEIGRVKRGIEEDRNLQVLKKNELQNAVTELSEMVLSLQKEEERLQTCVAHLEKRYVDGEQKKKQMVMEIDVLVEERKEREKNLENLIEEKGLVMKGLDEALKQLDDQKDEMEKIARKRMEVEEAKLRRESEIAELQKDIAKLRDGISTLEESCRVQIEKIKQLESQVNQHRGSLVHVNIERDEAIKGFDEEKKNTSNLRAKILEMEKNIEETHEVVGKMKAENCNLIDQKKELESRCSVLLQDVASLENTLSQARKEVDSMQAKVESTAANSELALIMLRKTAAFVCLSKDERDVVEDSTFADEQKAGGEIKPYVAELEAIKSAFKNGESKVEDMKRQLVALQNSEIEAHKRKSFWTLVSSASTIFAAASVAYIASGR